MRKIILFLLVVLFLVNCESNPPEIVNVFWHFTYRKDVLLNTESTDLALFINAKDADGPEDLETIYLFNDKEEYYWEINSDNWFKGNPWIGTNSIRMPDGSAVPDGNYRVVLQDVGGEKAEESVRIYTSQSARQYPKVVLNEGMLTVTGTQSAYALRIYNNNHKYISNYIITNGIEINIKQEILVKNNIQKTGYFEVYYPFQGAGIVIGPYYF